MNSSRVMGVAINVTSLSEVGTIRHAAAGCLRFDPAHGSRHRFDPFGLAELVRQMFMAVVN